MKLLVCHAPPISLIGMKKGRRKHHAAIDAQGDDGAVRSKGRHTVAQGKGGVDPASDPSARGGAKVDPGRGRGRSASGTSGGTSV